MVQEFTEWLEIHKKDEHKCYGEKKSGFKTGCNGDEQTIEHINLHDPESVQKILNDFKAREEKKEQAKRIEENCVGIRFLN